MSTPLLIPSLDMVTGDISTGIPFKADLARLASAEPKAGVDSPSRVHAVARKLPGSTPSAVTMNEPLATCTGLRSTYADDVTFVRFARAFASEFGKGLS